MSVISVAIALMNPIERIDELLRGVRSKSPILGWVLTALFMPIALAIGLAFIALVLVFGPGDTAGRRGLASDVSYSLGDWKVFGGIQAR